MRDSFKRLGTRRSQAEHPGLLLTRFLLRAPGEGKEGEAGEKRAVLEAVRTASSCPALLSLYRHAFARWKRLLRDLPEPHQMVEVATRPFTRVIVGLGNKGILEAGLRLHHTYGVPLLPGSALKGLTSHYCHEVWGRRDARYQRSGPFHALLFGTTEDGGAIRFEDGWMDPEGSAILPDVVTPHHQTWQTDPTRAPTDFDSPVPVPFLSVAGRFCIAVCWQGPKDERAAAWTKRALAILVEALQDWGVGGKTSSGYGRLHLLAAEVPTTPPPRAAAPQTKRTANVRVKVTIVGARTNGFDVQEEGRKPGTLTLGSPPPGLVVEVGSVVDVMIHNDDLKRPQYKWPDPPNR
jgi:CRISPR-associated protein Cmr6